MRETIRLDHSVFYKKLRPLKAFGQLLTDGLFDDARAGETDQRSRFRDVEIAQHGKTCRDAAGRGICQD